MERSIKGTPELEVQTEVVAWTSWHYWTSVWKGRPGQDPGVP